MNNFLKLKNIILNPNSFFNEIDSEKGFKKVLVFFFIILPVPFALLFLNFVFVVNLSSEVLYKMTAPMLLLVIIIYFILFLLLSFVLSFFTHIFIKAFGGQGNLSKTYQATIYASTPQLFLGTIPFVNMLTPLWFYVLRFIALSKFHKISYGRVFAADILAMISMLFIFLFIPIVFILLF